MIVNFVQLSQSIFGLLLVVYVENRVFLSEHNRTLVRRPEQVFLSDRTVAMTALVL